MKKLLAVAVLSLSFVMVGCSGVPYPVMRLYQDSVGQGYLKYLEEHEPDAERRRKRSQPVHSMEKRLKEAGA